MNRSEFIRCIRIIVLEYGAEVLVYDRDNSEQNLSDLTDDAVKELLELFDTYKE